MPNLHRLEIEAYLKSVVGQPVRLIDLTVLGKSGLQEIKGYGYGTPVEIDYEFDGEIRRAVLHTVTPGPFGHEHMSDRAQMLLWDHSTFNRLPRHVRSIDVAAFRRDGSAVSLGDVEEFFILTEYAEGSSYSDDLVRMRNDSTLKDIDMTRSDALCDYLVEIHGTKTDAPGLYVRRIRELVGHSECIMGLIDSYPPNHNMITGKVLKEIEQRCIDWRWRLKDRVHRLRQVHGDFHPWNILFRGGTEFTVLDRSRGEFGEPADDVTSLTMNYLFFSLQGAGRLAGGLETLFLRFWDRYLRNSEDVEMLQVAAPFFAFRGLVMAHPTWYPNLTKDVRQKLFNFIRGVLEDDRFHPERANTYCEA